MLQKMKMWSVLAHAKVTDFLQDLKKDERGLSGVVVAVLLILVAVLAVVLIWSLLKPQITAWWTSITGAADGIS